VYLASGDGIWVISSNGGGNEVFVAPAGAEVQALDPSPSGDRVAILLRESGATRAAFDVVVIGADGAVISRFDDLPPAVATPGPVDMSSRDLIDWSPQGGRLLVAYAGGVTFAVTLDSEEPAEPLSLAPEGTSLVDAAWSPTGEAIAFTTTRGDELERALWVHHVRSGTTERVVTADSGRFVVEFAWLPDGMSLLFTEAGDLEGAVSGIDLWSVDADGGNRQLVASAGTVAPVARITEIHPSPDGRSVAYAVLVPGDRGPRVDSVWIRDLTSRVGFRIALPTVASVDEIAWTDNGLAIAVTTTGTGQESPPRLALLQVTDDGQVSALWAAPLEVRTALGTPVATPIGT
jgi:hypothetical protein